VLTVLTVLTGADNADNADNTDNFEELLLFVPSRATGDANLLPEPH
jgi:hypothetical protein